MKWCNMIMVGVIVCSADVATTGGLIVGNSIATLVVVFTTVVVNVVLVTVVTVVVVTVISVIVIAITVAIIISCCQCVVGVFA